jgi:hypothetical protein
VRRQQSTPSAVLLCGALTAVQIICAHYLAGVSLKGGGVFFMGLLLYGLKRHSLLAWSLFVLLEAVPLLALAAASFSTGGETLWGNVAVMLLTGLPIVAVLLSRSMRRHVGLVGRAPRPSSALR